MAAERRLATVLFTDIVGSTARAAELGDRRWRELLDEHDARVREELERFGGDEVNTVGDGFVAAFDDPERALRGACAIRDSLRSIGLDVRCGLHTGEVHSSGKTIGGIAVHIAARLVEQARPAEVLVSQTVRDLVAGSGFGFAQRGEHELKGVPGEWRLFALTGEPVRVAAMTRWDRLRERVPRPSARNLLLAALGAALLFGLSSMIRLGRQDRPAGPSPVSAGGVPLGIAVLPFTVTGSAVEDLHEGMVDLLSTNLDGLGGLRTIDGRTVMARWRERLVDDPTPDLATTLDIARRTGARYAVVGSAVAIGSQARLDVNVFDLTTGAKIGSAQVQGSPDSLFSVANRLSLRVLETVLESDVTDHARIDLARITTDSLAALRAYLDGEAAFRRSDFASAIAAYRRAVEIDSSFALAYVRLSSAYTWIEDIRLSAGYLAKAEALAHRLPEREAMLVQATRLLYDGSLQVLDRLRSVVERYPDDPEAWFLLGEAAYHLGDQALLPQREYREAFARTTALDSSFTPAYIHLISDALFRADSSRVAKLLSDYERFAVATSYDTLARFSIGMAFGGKATRSSTLSVLDTLPPEYAANVARDLWNVRFLDLQERILRPHASAGSRWGATAKRLLFYNGLNRGRLNAALKALDDAQPARGEAGGLMYVARAWGLPVPGSRIDRELGGEPGPDATDEWLFFAGAHAVDADRGDARERALNMLRERSQTYLAGGDSAGARRTRAEATALEGYAAWRHGEPERGLELLEAARPGLAALHDPGEAPPEAATVRIWIGKLLQELGRRSDAELYLRSFWVEVPALLDLGFLHRDLGRLAEAREELERFLEAWKDPDPELAPLQRKAREALGELAAAGVR